MWLKESTIRNQEKIAEYCRTGNMKPIDGVMSGRIEQYRRLVHGVFADTLETAFPITQEVLLEDEWDLLIDAFIAEHKSATPQIWKLPYELVVFAKEENWAVKISKPYLNDLLLFEWLEIDVHTMPDVETFPHILEGNIRADKIVITPEFVVQRLEYPVHRFGAKESMDEQGEYFVLVYRTQLGGDVKFLDVTPPLVFIIEKLRQRPMSLSELVSGLKTLLKVQDNTKAENQLSLFFERMKEMGFVIGFQK